MLRSLGSSVLTFVTGFVLGVITMKGPDVIRKRFEEMRPKVIVPVPSSNVIIKKQNFKKNDGPQRLQKSTTPQLQDVQPTQVDVNPQPYEGASSYQPLDVIHPEMKSQAEDIKPIQDEITSIKDGDQSTPGFDIGDQ